MSQVGAGGEDWVEVEVDLDRFERDRSMAIEVALADHHDRLAEFIGPDFDVEADGAGLVHLTVDGRRRFRVDVGRDGRLIVTGIPDPEGPL